jgi:ABC-type tungstate transport system permease subunit
MKTQDTEFLARLRAAFEAEAAEHLQTISTGLLDLEKHAATAEA